MEGQVRHQWVTPFRAAASRLPRAELHLEKLFQAVTGSGARPGPPRGALLPAGADSCSPCHTAAALPGWRASSQGGRPARLRNAPQGPPGLGGPPACPGGQRTEGGSANATELPSPPPHPESIAPRPTAASRSSRPPRAHLSARPPPTFMGSAR